jgi:very-short-patch-repair endonuclease
MDLYALAASQHGAVSVPQLRQMGFTYDAIEHLVASGEWERVTTVVIRRTGAPKTKARDCCEAVLDAGLGAALSHTSGAAWWRLPAFNLWPLHVTRTRKRSDTPARLATIHEPRLFPDHHRTVLKGVPVCSPTRIVFDIAALAPHRAEVALDRAWARNLLSHRTMTTMLHELSQRGRTGLTLVRTLMAERGPDYRPNDTGLEDRFQQLCRRAGLEVERQRNLGGEEWLGRVDFICWRLKLVLEVDSALYHEALIDQRRDAARKQALEAVGFRVENFTDTEVWLHGAATVERLRLLRSGR